MNVCVAWSDIHPNHTSAVTRSSRFQHSRVEKGVSLLTVGSLCFGRQTDKSIALSFVPDPPPIQYGDRHELPLSTRIQDFLRKFGTKYFSFRLISNNLQVNNLSYIEQSIRNWIAVFEVDSTY